MSYLYQDEFAAKLASTDPDGGIYSEEDDEPLVPEEDFEDDEFGDESDEDKDSSDREDE